MSSLNLARRLHSRDDNSDGRRGSWFVRRSKRTSILDWPAREHAGEPQPCQRPINPFGSEALARAYGHHLDNHVYALEIEELDARRREATSSEAVPISYAGSLEQEISNETAGSRKYPGNSLTRRLRSSTSFLRIKPRSFSKAFGLKTMQADSDPALPDLERSPRIPIVLLNAPTISDVQIPSYHLSAAVPTTEPPEPISLGPPALAIPGRGKSHPYTAALGMIFTRLWDIDSTGRRSDRVSPNSNQRASESSDTGAQLIEHPEDVNDVSMAPAVPVTSNLNCKADAAGKYEASPSALGSQDGHLSAPVSEKHAMPDLMRRLPSAAMSEGVKSRDYDADSEDNSVIGYRAPDEPTGLEESIPRPGSGPNIHDLTPVEDIIEAVLKQDKSINYFLAVGVLSHEVFQPQAGRNLLWELRELHAARHHLQERHVHFEEDHDDDQATKPTLETDDDAPGARVLGRLVKLRRQRARDRRFEGRDTDLFPSSDEREGDITEDATFTAVENTRSPAIPSRRSSLGGSPTSTPPDKGEKWPDFNPSLEYYDGSATVLGKRRLDDVDDTLTSDVDAENRGW